MNDQISNVNNRTEVFKFIFNLAATLLLSMVFIFLLSESISGFRQRFAIDKFIKEGLRSPSSYKSVDYNIIWSGVDRQSKHQAEIYEVKFDAANAFNASIRDCRIIATYGNALIGYSFHENVSQMECAEKEKSLGLMIELNGFEN